MWGLSSTTAGARLLLQTPLFHRERRVEIFSYHREVSKPLIHICCIYTVAELIPHPLIHPQHSTILVTSQNGLCQTLSWALDQRNYLHQEALFGSAVVREQINGRKRSGKKLSLQQLHPYEQPLAHTWRLEEKCTEKQECCWATVTCSYPGGCPKRQGCWSKALHLVIYIIVI